MGLMGKVKSAKTEKTEDRVGGFKIHPTDVYDAVVKSMYASKTDNGSIGVTLELDLFLDPNSDKTTRFTTTQYVTNSEGENFYISTKDKKKYMNSSWLLIDAIAIFATDGDAGLADLETEIITVKKRKDGKEINVDVESYPEVEGLEIKVGIVAVNEPVSKKVDGKYVDTDEMRDTNKLERIFNEDGFTLLEWEDGLDKPEFMAKWLKEWKGKTKAIKPKTSNTEKTGGNGRGAAAQRGRSSPPTRGSRFGNR